MIGTTDAKDYSGFRHGPNLAPSHTASDGLMKSTEFIPSQHASEDQLLSVNRRNNASGLNRLLNVNLIPDEEEENGATPGQSQKGLATYSDKEQTP